MRRQTPPKKLHSWFPMLPTRSASQSRLKSSIIEQFPRCTQACTSTHRPDNSHINPLLRAWAAPPTFIFKSLRSTKQVTACNMGFTREQHAITAADLPKVQTTSPTTAHFQRFSAKWSAVWTLALVTRSLHTADRGNYIIRDPTRRRHASSQLLMLQNPHDRRRGERARTTPEPMCISCPDVDRLSGCR